jgi:purine catabolism regulator
MVDFAVRDLLDIPDLELTLLAGHSGLGRPIRWTYISELTDPVPWMLGGELVLTTGLAFRDADTTVMREYVERLVAASAAALGIGLGHHAHMADVPHDVLAAAEVVGLPVILVGQGTGFVEVSEQVALRLSAVQLKRARRILEGQKQIAQAAVRDGAHGIVTALAHEARAQVVMVDRGTRVLHASSPEPEPLRLQVASLLERIRPRGWFASSSHEDEHHLVLHPVGFGQDYDFILAVELPASTSPDEVNLLISHAACLLAIETAAERHARHRRTALRSAVLGGLVQGDLPAKTADALFKAIGLQEAGQVDVALWATRVDGSVLDSVLEGVLSEADRTNEPIRYLHGGDVVVVSSAGLDWEKLAGRAQERLGCTVSVGVATTAPEGVGNAIRAAGVAATRARRTAALVQRSNDIGGLAALRIHLDEVESSILSTPVLRPLIEYDSKHSTDLLPSLRAFLEACGHWGRAADRLGVHRNTLRTRMATVEEITRRKIDNPEDRLDLWLALRLSDPAP